ncbi:MAG: hypothetical protein K8R92_08540 [Planctomycetes bacterium]|nr:hypothetical protein [Planctomycetota bacterium]
MNTKLLPVSLLSTALFASFASAATTPLYGISSVGLTTTFCSIDTSTGAATALFSFSHTSGLSTNGLTYNPTNNKFVAVHFITTNSAELIEIDAGAQTATVVANQIPTAFFEGLEYSTAEGGLVVSYGANQYTGNLALLNNSYNLLAFNNATGLVDGDTLVTDGTGSLHVMDTNNPTGGYQYNLIGNPFAVMGFSGVPANNFNPLTDFDMAYKGDEGLMFLTRQISLATVGAGNVITTIGAFGVDASGAEYRMTGIAAMPAPGVASILGLAGLMSRRRR